MRPLFKKYYDLVADNMDCPISGRNPYLYYWTKTLSDENLVSATFGYNRKDWDLLRDMMLVANIVMRNQDD